ncbi:hypothetical protein JCM6882_008604 [Rhodosporidiobolus microsporus]
MVHAHRRRTRRSRTTALLVATALLAPTSTSASFLSSSFDSLRARALLPRAAAGTVLSTDNSTAAASSSFPVVVDATSHEGRYGHSAVYLPAPTNELLLLGGQLDSNGTAPEITASSLTFRLASTFLWGDRPVSAIPDNPAVDSALSSGISASAWGAAAADEQGRTWLFGGVTADCETDSVASVYSNGTWSAVDFSPRMPPRRRQASAVPVLNATTGGTDVWIFGGIAEQYTCSSDGSTVGYVGMDRYDTVNEVVESMAWSAPEGAGEGWLAPVSDYTATPLDDEGSVLIVGGQTAQGTLSHIDEVLLFDVATRSWTSQVVYGPTPPARMGHIAVPLSSGNILVHGGLSATHGPLSDVYLLSPSAGNYTWTEIVISSSSMLSPSLAWHTANLVPGETIVVAFGIDSTTATTSSDFWFLSVDEDEGTYSWKDTFDGNADALEEGDSATTTASRLAKKALEVIVNPKAESLLPHSSSTASPAATQPAYYGGGGGSYNDGGAAAEPVSTSTTRSSSSIVVPSSTPSAKNNASSSANDDNSSSSTKTTAIAATLGSIGGAVALVGLAFLAFRRRAATQAAAAYSHPHSPMMGHAPDGQGGAGGLKPVSTLLYTRPVQRRMMSLGSTISPMPSPRFPDDGAENLAGIGSAAAGLGVDGAAAGHFGASPDPFSDDYKVNELGQLERAGSSASAGSTGAAVGVSTSVGSALKSSVQSIPFLSSITHTSPTGDVYTSPAPTLSSKRSLRRPAQALPPLPQTSPVPQTPAELIGLAVTSDDGHTPISASEAAPAAEEPEGLPYLRNEGEKEEPRAKLVEKKPSTPAPSAAAANGGLPSSLRPGTPLRIANPDPFADQPQQQ